MDLSDLGGAGGWLSSLIGGGGGAGAPPSLAAPGTTAPTPDSAGMPVAPPNPNAPTLMKGLASLGSGAGSVMPKMPPPPPAPTLQMPQTHQQPYAQALAQVMAQLNAKPQPGSMLPQGTQ